METSPDFISSPAMYLTLAMALLLMVQSVGFVLALLKLTKLIRRIETGASGQVRKIETLLQETSGSLAQLAAVTARIPEIAGRSETLLGQASSVLSRTDETAAKALQRATLSVEETGRRIDLALSRFSRQSTRMLQSTERPAKEVAAFLTGIRVGFKTWRAGLQETSRPEDDRFIG